MFKLKQMNSPCVYEPPPPKKTTKTTKNKKQKTQKQLNVVKLFRSVKKNESLS